MTTFETELEKLRPKLPLPYPERKRLLRELLADMDSFYEDALASGANPTLAREETLKRFSLRYEDYQDLESVHRSRAEKVLTALPPTLRQLVLDCLKLSGVLGFIYILFMEAPVREFLYQGGPIVYLIIGVGLSGLAVQLNHFFRWFLKKDHSDQSLEKNSSAPLAMAFITFLLGVLSTAMGYYTVLTKWAAGVGTSEEMRVGLYEPIPCLVVATAMAICIVGLHVVTQWQLRVRGVPRGFLQSA
jgi:NADH:ubiquinone oxidoreductase subunit 5 (subunit L)/multisubunit Na+/H+ antiporter MnhA subunit